MANSVVQQVEQAIEPILKDMNIELVDVQYRKEDGEHILRIFIDTEDGVDLNICTEATRAVKDIIDNANINYGHLEVSSPGVDRVIKKDKYPQRFIGERIKVKTLKDFEGPRTVVGILAGLDNNMINLQVDEQEVQIPWEMTSVVRLHPDL